MTEVDEIKFGFQLSAVDAAGSDDASLYRSLLRDADLGYRLGYDTAWVVEHHFSDYFPQPGPLALLAHVAARCPGIGLGAMVLVTPWYQPVRLAGEIAMLSHLSQGDLHLGLGRGNAPLEYEAFDVPMAEAKQRYAECWQILQLAMTGQVFTYEGTHLRVTRELRIRPAPLADKIHFYGAIGNPASARKIAELGLAPICNGSHPFNVQKQVLDIWADAMKAQGKSTSGRKPVGVNLIIADTDAEADALARKLLPHWFELQVEHYKFDASRHHDLPDYAPFAQTHARRIALTNPANLDPVIAVSLIGSPKTVISQLQRYVDCGFNSFILQTGLPGMPQQLRETWLRRFAGEIAPHFSANFCSRTTQAA